MENVWSHSTRRDIQASARVIFMTGRFSSHILTFHEYIDNRDHIWVGKPTRKKNLYTPYDFIYQLTKIRAE